MREQREEPKNAEGEHRRSPIVYSTSSSEDGDADADDAADGLPSLSPSPQLVVDERNGNQQPTVPELSPMPTGMSIMSASPSVGAASGITETSPSDHSETIDHEAGMTSPFRPAVTVTRPVVRRSAASPFANGYRTAGSRSSRKFAKPLGGSAEKERVTSVKDSVDGVDID